MKSLTSLSLLAAAASQANAAITQQIALASYIPPFNTDTWNRLVSYDKNKVSVLVANPSNGPDSAVDPAWKDVIDRSINSGKKVLGYVRTGYLGQSSQQFTTRAGSLDPADWAAQVERDVDTWYQLYGTKLGGIFFDEGYNICGDDDDFAHVYAHINDYTKRKYPGAYTVLNPGAPMPQCFEHTMDTLMTFEHDYNTYVNNFVNIDWKPSDPRKIWHIIYNVPEGEVANVAALAEKHGAGLVQITNDDLPNPYDTLPSDSYMNAHLNAITGGSPAVGGPTNYPAGVDVATPQLKVEEVDYSTVRLSWTESADAEGYRVYVGKENILDFANTVLEVTVGGFQPGTSNTFTVRAIGGSGKETPDSNVVTANTQALPRTGTISNLSSTVSGGSTTYEADVLVPYGHVRAYIWQGENNCPDPAWWVILGSNYVCAKYMIEDGTLYKYNGQKVPDGQPIPYSWAPIGTAVPKVDGYTYSFTVPNANITIDSKHFAFQAEHYAPLNTVLTPCPKFAGANSAIC